MALDRDKIIGALRSARLDEVADRLDYLQDLAEDDPDETPIDRESMRHFASFVTAWHLTLPEISTNPDGLISVEWTVQKLGTLVIVFLPSGLVRFAAILKQSESRKQEWEIAGTLPLGEMKDAVKPFLNELIIR